MTQPASGLTAARQVRCILYEHGRSNRPIHSKAAGDQRNSSERKSTTDLDPAKSLAPLAEQSHSNQVQSAPASGGRRAMMKVKAVAERMGISDSLVYELCACGALPHVRIGRPGSRGCIRLTEDDIQEFLARQRVEGEVPATVPPRQQKPPFTHVVIPK